MPERSPRWLPPLRGATLAALCTLLTATGHLVGGGALPGLAPLVVLFPMLAAVVAELGHRCRSVASVLAVLGAGQVVLHYVLVVLAPHAHGDGAAVSAVQMLAMHLLATLVLAVMVRCADSALLALFAALCRVLPRRPPLVPVDGSLPTRAVPEADVPMRLIAALAWADSRRGPPITC